MGSEEVGDAKMRSRLWTVMRFEERIPGDIVLSVVYLFGRGRPGVSRRYPAVLTSSLNSPSPPPST